MFRKNISKYIAIGYFSLLLAACKMPVLVTKTENKTTPASYTGTANNANTSQKKWHDYFTDPFLVALIDTALKNNQELNITLQEIEIARNEARAKKGEYLPFVGVKGSAGLDKSSRYTQQGANDPNAEIAPGREIPEPLANYGIGAYAQWEVDIWHKLRNVRKAALYRYVATQEGKNFVVTQLIAEIANSYYELLALDNQLAIIDQNIEIQTNALAIVRLQKEAGRTTELAVRKFEAEVLNTQSLQYGIKQKITETENRINFLLGRFPQPIKRNDQSLISLTPTKVSEGIPAQLLEQRPDVRQAEQLLSAAKLDIKVARAQFYPSLGLLLMMPEDLFL
ncbi:MAG: TolC family protein [Chitinophagia bacterium]|nr:TolC family protein [Chitinophagia bacterium]